MLHHQEILSLLPKFQEYQRSVDNRSEDTIKSYATDIRQFAEYVAESGGGAAGKQEVVGFTISLAEKKLSASSRARKLIAIRQFYAWAVLLGYETENPADGVKGPSIGVKAPEIISRDAKEALLIAARNGVSEHESKNFMRDLAIIMVFLGTGCRRAELRAIDLKDVDLKENCLLLHGKGNKERRAYFGDAVRAVLVEYISEYRKPVGEALFPSNKSDRLCLREINRIVDKYMQAAGIKEPGKSCHALRKRNATDIYSITHDIYLTAYHLGHNSIETTKRYAGVENDRMKAAAAAVAL